MTLKKLQCLVLIAVAGAVASTGCRNRKAAECDKFISVINDNGKTIKAASSKMTGTNDDTKTYEEVAGALETSAEQIKGVGPKDEKLAGFAKEYEEMLRGGAQAAREVVKAQGAQDLGALSKAIGEIGKVETTEATLVAKVNGYCAAE